MDFNEVMNIFYGDTTTLLKMNEHGRLVERRFEAYHDVSIFEDGHEDWYYIGD